MPIVIDASMTMAWCFEDESTPHSEAVLDRLHDDVAVVPALWQFEVANVLLVAARRQRLTEAQVARFVELLSSLPISTDLDVVDIGDLVAAGRRHGLSAYDASYLLLAERGGAELATLDRPLADAARTAGISVVGS